MTHPFDHALAWTTGRTILLAGSPPFIQDTNLDDTTARAAEEAIVSLARAAFANNVRLVFAGPSDSALLLATIAAEYAPRRYAEGPNLLSGEVSDLSRSLFMTFVNKSEADRRLLTDHLELLHQAGYFALTWQDEANFTISDIIGSAQADALVCIGGAWDEVAPIINAARRLRPGMPIHAMTTTGGAAAQLARQEFILDNRNPIVAYDQAVIDRLESSVRRDRQGTQQEIFVQGIAPYPLIMQDLIASIASDHRS